MNETKAERLARLLNRLAELGFSFSEAQRLRRIEGTLSRWSTEECNGTIQREGDDGEGKPFRVNAGNFGFGGKWTENRYPIPDREAGARKQLAAIMAEHPKLWHYIQGDPRGCALYVGRKSDLKTDSNQIVRKAQSWGANIRPHAGGFNAGFINKRFDTEEAAAVAYLKHRNASIPARYVLPLSECYNRGTAVCV